MKTAVRILSLVLALLGILLCLTACGKEKKTESAFVGGFETPEETAVNSVLCIAKADIAGLMDMVPDLLVPSLAKTLGLKDSATRKEVIDSINKLGTVGAGIEGIDYTATATSTEIVKLADADEIVKDLCSALGIAKKDLKAVSEYALVDVKIEATLGEEKNTSNHTVKVAKIKDRWYFLNN